MTELKKCKKCGRNLIQKATKRTAEQLQKQYYYTAYYYCPHCRKLYHDEKFRVVNESKAGLFGGDLTLPSPKRRGFKEENYDAEIWTDGACVSNGRPNARAAWAFVSGKKEGAGLVPGVKQTNNVAEGLAILKAFEWAVSQNFKKIKIYTDSQISLHNLNKPASLVKQNQALFQDIENVIKKNNLVVSYEKVLGHSGDVNNSRADKLANDLASEIASSLRSSQ